MIETIIAGDGRLALHFSLIDPPVIAAAHANHLTA
jgi:hypothetical protein